MSIKTVLLFCSLSIILLGCSAGYHLRRAKFHERMAYAKGAEIQNDTIYKEIPVSFPEVWIDTVYQDVNFADTLSIEKQQIKTVVKVNTVKKLVYVKTVCPPKYIKIRERTVVTKTYTIPPVKHSCVIKWWLLIALFVGAFIKWLLWK